MSRRAVPFRHSARRMSARGRCVHRECPFSVYPFDVKAARICGPRLTVVFPRHAVEPACQLHFGSRVVVADNVPRLLSVVHASDLALGHIDEELHIAMRIAANRQKQTVRISSSVRHHCSANGTVQPRLSLFEFDDAFAFWHARRFALAGGSIHRLYYRRPRNVLADPSSVVASSHPLAVMTRKKFRMGGSFVFKTRRVTAYDRPNNVRESR